MSVSTDEFRAGLRLLTGGVSLITTGHAPDRTGLIATAVMSLTASPPQIVIGVNHNASAYKQITQNGHFVVNVLACGDTAIADVFSGKTGLKGEARFAGETWATLITGSPVRENAIVSLDCTVMSEVSVDTHSLFVGLVEAVQTRDEPQPLLHFNGGWAALQPLIAVQSLTA